MAHPLYYINEEDQFFPKIAAVGPDDDDPADGMSFGDAKEALLKLLRSRRDHWNDAIKEAKKLTRKDVS